MRFPLEPSTLSPYPPLFGGRQEPGQNFLIHRPTIPLVLNLVRSSGSGSILELGAGNGAPTRPLAALGRDLLAIGLDPGCVRRLQRRLPGVQVQHSDALPVPYDRPEVVGNIPFHLTTPFADSSERVPGPMRCC